MDRQAFELWGVPHGPSVRFDDLSAHIHPADRDRVFAPRSPQRAELSACMKSIFAYWSATWCDGFRHGTRERIPGIVGRIMYGIFIHVTGRKQAEEGNELLAGEISHRVNLLAIATALTTITSGSTTTSAEMATELTQRLTALGRAHDLVG